VDFRSVPGGFNFIITFVLDGTYCRVALKDTVAK